MKNKKQKLQKRQQKKIREIKFRPELFWDVDPKTIDPQKHARYIIERVLDFGEINELEWLFHYYSNQQIKKTLHEFRSPIHEKSKSLWSLVLQ